MELKKRYGREFKEEHEMVMRKSECRQGMAIDREMLRKFLRGFKWPVGEGICYLLNKEENMRKRETVIETEIETESRCSG